MDEIQVGDQQTLAEAFEKADNMLMKRYISNLCDYNIIPLADEIKINNVSNFTRLFKINRVVYEKEEDILDKLASCYNALYACGGSVILMINSDGSNIDYYLGTRAEEGYIATCQSVLSKAIKGNFPGSEVYLLKNNATESVVESIFESNYENRKKSMAAISGVSSFRDSYYESQKEGFVQGIEKLVDAMRGEKYSVVVIADPISQNIMDTIQNGYEELYSNLTPFGSSELNFSANESTAVTKGITTGFSKTVNENLTKTQGYTTGTTKNYSTSSNDGFAFLFSVGSSSTAGHSEMWNETGSEAKTTGTSNMETEQKQESETDTKGSTRGIQIKFQNKSVSNLLDKIDEQLVRLKECRDIGMWNCATYIISDDVQTTKVVASTYQALMRGENSSVENAAINIWSEKNQQSEFEAYLKKLTHPLIDISKNDLIAYVTPNSLISAKELNIQAGLPQKSVPGLPVIEYASFGREVAQQNDSHPDIYLGRIFHMGKEEALDVTVDLQSLASHTFITGSTGSGKSNTIYKLLAELNQKDVKFLVIEPAKGEYKNIFSNRDDVNIFGTNPYITQLLRINPFKFPVGVHVLEHLDRLVEIFNVCWPMYAAMPAVLKEAIEGAYISSGWDLDSSNNKYDNNLFPTFTDVLFELDRVISESAYSEEVKGNYRGSLFTRVKSLTNGLYRRIFCSDELDSEIIFDSNTIIDLSRIGSVETKSMIMGILVMRLQEYRISKGGMNLPLKHITVLEEAHNLLKRVSTEQVSESANLTGKSVEMLANAIAEMRTYGEGFIIADQSPGLLDLSVIRNTNTKIILRLPDKSDRELVGYAASLNDFQIVELAKLQTGVAAVYQNNWLYPVLCKVEKIDNNEEPYAFHPPPKQAKHEVEIKKDVITYLLKDHLNESIDLDIDDLCEKIIKSSLATGIKTELLESVNNNVISFEKASRIINRIVYSQAAIAKSKDTKDFNDWNREMLSNLDAGVQRLEPLYMNTVLQCILAEQARVDKDVEKFYFGWVDFMKGGVLF